MFLKAGFQLFLNMDMKIPEPLFENESKNVMRIKM